MSALPILGRYAPESGDGVRRWGRVKECPSCGQPRCKVSPDGSAALCFREVGENGKAGKVVVLKERVRQPVVLHRRHEDERPCAPDATLDAIYRQFLLASGITPEHRDKLLARGFTPQHLDRLLASGRYGSTGTRSYRDALARADRIAFETAPGQRVPLPDTVAPSATLVGIQNEHGQITGIRLRLDNPGTGGKYRWPVGSRSRPHVARPSGPVTDLRVWVTEGEVKADLAAERLGAIVVSIPGVNVCHVEAAKLVHALGDGPAILAFDADKATNPNVLLAQTALAKRLEHVEGIPAWIASWPASAGKGLDDLLVGGGTPTVGPAKAPPLPAPGPVQSARSTCPPSLLERFVLLMAADHAPTKTAAKGLLAASLCGVFAERRECAAHGTREGPDRTLVCERWCCTHFANAHARDFLKLVEGGPDTPKETAVGVATGPDTPEGVSLLRASIRKALGKLVRLDARAAGASAQEAWRVAARAVSRLGFFVAPGLVAVVSPDPDDAARFRRLGLPGLDGSERASRKRLRERLEPVVYARADRLHAKLRAADVKALGSDPWTNRVVAPTGGKLFRAEWGWPSMDDLREEARPDAPCSPCSSGSKCCGGPIRYSLVDQRSGQVYTSRIGFPWSEHELPVTVTQVERGWPGG